MDLDKFFQETDFGEVDKRLGDKQAEEQSQAELPTDGDCDGCKI